MASRIISTRIAIEGESEYKRSVANINSALGAMKAELGAVKAEYNANANGMDALRAKGEAMSKVQEAQVAMLKEVSAALENAKRTQQEYAAKVEAAQAKVQAEEQQLEAMTGSSNRAKKAREELTASLEKHRKELADAERYHEAAQRGVNGWTKALGNTKKGLSNLNLEMQKNDQHLTEAKKSTDGCATSIDQYGKKVKGAKEVVVDSSGAIAALAGAVAASGVKAAFDEVAAAITACIDASVQFESAMTGVYKTVDGSGAQLEAITRGIRAMALEIPASTTEIAGVAAAAGQLGIATDDILGFTRVMVDLGSATNLSVGEAATAFARLANITGMAAEDYGRLGSSVVALGNSFATTESEITAMATRLAAAGSVSGLNEAQILAVAAALSSVGIEAEAGGSAVSRLMKEFEVMVVTGSDKLSAFARVAGMSAEQFSAAWRSDAVGALSGFIEGLGRLDSAGNSSVAVLEELGITEVRMSDAVLRLAGAGDLLTRAVETSNGAWAENTALTDEASQRYETTESKLALVSNAFQELKISVGDVYAPAVRAAAESGAELLTWAADVVEEYPAVVAVLGAVVAALGTLIAAIAAYAVAVHVVIPLVTAFHTAITAPGNTVGLVVTALSMVVAALGALSLGLKGVIDETRGWSDETRRAMAVYREEAQAMEAATGGTDRLIAALGALSAKEEKTAADKQAILGLVRELNEVLPELCLNYDQQTDSLNMTTEAIQRMVAAQREQAQVDNTQDALAKLYGDQIDLAQQLEAAQQKLADAERSYAEMDGMEKKNTRQQMSFEGYKNAMEVAKLEIARLTAEQATNEAQIAAVSGDYEALTVEIEETRVALAGAAEVAALTTEELTAMEAASAAQGKAAKTLTGQMDALSSAFAEQERNGSLSVGTMLSLIDAGYAAALSIDQETGAARLNTEAFLALASAKLDEQMASVADSVRENRATALAQEGAAATAAAGGFLDLAYSYRTAADAATGAADNAEANLAVLQQLKDSLGKIPTGSWSSRPSSSGSGGSKGGSKKEKTSAELELEAYRAAVAELSHLRAMDEVSEEEYYRRKAELGEQYLQNSLEERRKLSEELHTYQQGAYDRAVEALDQALEGETISYQQHYEGLQALAGTAQAAGEEAQRDHRKRMEQNRKGAYDEEMADQKYFLDMGITTEGEYYAELRRLRDAYLVENSEAWRAATVELYKYEEQLRKEALEALKQDQEERMRALKEAYDQEEAALKKTCDEQKAEAKKRYDEESAAAKEAYDTKKADMKKLYALQKDAVKELYDTQKKAAKDAYDAQKTALKNAYDAQKAAAKEAYNAKKEAIQRELALEQERLNGILEGIDAEIQARRELREDEDLDGAIAAAQKRLDAAKAELTFARTDEEKQQWSDEIIRLEKALQEAVQNKEDTEFYREKELEKEAVREELDAAQTAADGKLDAAAKEYEALSAQMEAAYKTDTARLEAAYQDKAADLEAAHKYSMASLEADYEAKQATAEAAHKAAMDQITSDYEARLHIAETEYKNALKALKEGFGAASGGGGGSGGGAKDERYNQQDWSDEVRAISRANGVDLGVAQDMYNANQWNKDEPGYKPYSNGGYTPGKDLKEVARTAARAMGAAMASAATAASRTVAQQITKNSAANVTVNASSAPTSGQLRAFVRRALEDLDR